MIHHKTMRRMLAIALGAALMSPASAIAQTRVTAGPVAITFPVGTPEHQVLPPAAAELLKKRIAEHPDADAHDKDLLKATLESDGWGYRDEARGIIFMVRVMPTTPALTKRDASGGCASKDAKEWPVATCRDAKAGQWRGYAAERVGAGGGYMAALTMQKPGELVTVAYLGGAPSDAAHDEALRFISSMALDGVPLQLNPASH